MVPRPGCVAIAGGNGVIVGGGMPDGRTPGKPEDRPKAPTPELGGGEGDVTSQVGVPRSGGNGGRRPRRRGRRGGQAEERRLGLRNRRGGVVDLACRRVLVRLLVEHLRRLALLVEDVRRLVFLVPVHVDRGVRVRGHARRAVPGLGGRFTGRRRWNARGPPRRSDHHRRQRCSTGRRGRGAGRRGRQSCFQGRSGHPQERPLRLHGSHDRRWRRRNASRTVGRMGGRRLFPETLEDIEVRSGLFVLCHGTGLLHVPPTEDTTETESLLGKVAPSVLRYATAVANSACTLRRV